jgi:RNA polymerase sigma-70 factor (ECF subfamily)
MALPGGQRMMQRLVQDHYQSLYRYAFRLTGSATDAEDLTQEAYCKAQLKLGQLRDPERARPWLFSILRNAYLHRLRELRQGHPVPLDSIAEVAEPQPDPLPEVDPERLQAALNELPEAFRSVVILYYFEEFSYRDIAEQMDLPMGTVMSRLSRAKACLRQKLQPETVSGPGTAEGRRADGM